MFCYWPSFFAVLVDIKTPEQTLMKNPSREKEGFSKLYYVFLGDDLKREQIIGIYIYI